MTSSDKSALLRAAIAAVRDCADTMETQAARFPQSLPEAAIDEELRARALALSAGLKDASGRVTFELALLQAETGEGKVDLAIAVKRLSAMDSAMMSAVAALAEVVDQLEQVAERDMQCEPAFVLVIEAAGVMLQRVGEARRATEALSDALKT